MSHMRRPRDPFMRSEGRTLGGTVEWPSDPEVEHTSAIDDAETESGVAPEPDREPMSE